MAPKPCRVLQRNYHRTFPNHNFTGPGGCNYSRTPIGDGARRGRLLTGSVVVILFQKRYYKLWVSVLKEFTRVAYIYISYIRRCDIPTEVSKNLDNQFGNHQRALSFNVRKQLSSFLNQEGERNICHQIFELVSKVRVPGEVLNIESCVHYCYKGRCRPCSN